MMHGPQIERLKRDSRELEYFIRKMEKRGDLERAYVIKKRLLFLCSKIEEMEENFNYQS